MEGLFSNFVELILLRVRVFQDFSGVVLGFMVFSVSFYNFRDYFALFGSGQLLLYFFSLCWSQLVLWSFLGVALIDLESLLRAMSIKIFFVNF